MQRMDGEESERQTREEQKLGVMWFCERLTRINMMSEFTYAYSCHPINFPRSLSGWYDQDGARGVFYRAGGGG